MPKTAPANARLTLILDLGLFLCGVVAGWFIYPAPIYSVALRPKPSLSELRGERPYNPVKQLSSTLHRLRRIDRQDDLARAVEQLPTRELPSLLTLLMNGVGFEGLQESDWGVLRALLWSWHGRDSLQAISWALGLSNPANRLPVMEVLVEAEASVDPVRAITLSHEHLVDEAGHLFLPDEAYHAALQRGGDVLLVCLKQSVHASTACRTLILDFPADFDFPDFAGKLGEHVASLPGDLHPAALPSNLAEQWAEQDPAAAFTWTLQNPAAVTRGTLRRLAEVIAQSPADNVAAFLFQLREDGNTSPADVHRGLIAVLHADPDRKIFPAYMEFFETPDQKHVQLVGLFRQSLRKLRRPERRIQRLILERVPTGDQARFLLEVAARRDADGETAPLPTVIRTALRRELSSLGHSPAKIDSMLAHF